MNTYQQNYKEQAIMTMTQAELLDLVYDELLNRLKKAEIALSIENIELFNTSIDKCGEIVSYLKNTLDFKYPISYELLNMYNFFVYEISRVKSSRKPEIIMELRPLVEDLKVTFKQAGNLA